jgi:transcription elongation factor GreA
MPTADAAMGTGMPIPIDGGGTLTFMSQDTSTKDFAEQERERLEAELADLRRRRDQLRADLQGDAETVGDRGDAAEALQRADDLAGVEEQISRVTWLLAGGNAAVPGQLPNGTKVTLRFPDDDADIAMRVVNFIEETPAGEEDTTLTADSPLGLALFGRKAGETITYRTPRGELQVKLLAVEQP